MQRSSASVCSPHLMHTLRATYRLQFEPAFRFAEAVSLVSALAALTRRPSAMPSRSHASGSRRCTASKTSSRSTRMATIAFTSKNRRYGLSSALRGAIDGHQALLVLNASALPVPYVLPGDVDAEWQVAVVTTDADVSTPHAPAKALYAVPARAMALLVRHPPEGVS